MNDELKRINNPNVVDQIIQSLMNSIISGKYQAGMKLPSEYELSEELGASRNSVREAMKILSAVGIVEIKRGDGTYVCSSTKPSVFDTAIYSILYSGSSDEELLELRQVIDEEILRFSMKKITPSEIESLKKNIDRMGDALNAGKYDRAEQLDYEFHLGLIESCKNKFFIHLMKGVYSIFEKSIIQTVEFEKKQSEVIQHHKAILRCVAEKDESAVHEVISNSLRTWQASPRTPRMNKR